MSVVIENTTPGVSAIVNAGQVSRPIQRQPSSTAFLIGYSAWGPVNTPTVITSWQDFVRKFGGFNSNSYLPDAVYAFFNHYGGKQAIIVRTIGGTPVKATRNLMDGAGTPLATVRVDGKHASTLVDIRVTVAAGTAANSRKLTFRSVYLGITEVYDNVTLAADSLAAVSTTSKLVTLTNLNSATTAPNNLPAVAAEAALTAGDDDFAGLDATEYVAGIATLANENLGGGQVAVPGITDASVYAALKTHCELFQRLGIIDPALGNNVSAMLAVDTTAYRSAHLALYYPWVKMQRLDGVAGTKFYPPSIFAVGACALVDRTTGTHKAPANIPAYGAIDVEVPAEFTDGARGALNAKQINVIGPIEGQGILIYGARTLYPVGETRVQFVHQRRLLNLIYYSAKLGYAWAPFSVVDGAGRLFRDLRAGGQNFLRQMWRDGALFGATEKEAFLVTCDVSNNPPEQLDLGIVRVQLGVKLSPTAEQIVINIDSVPLSQDLNVLNGGAN